MPMNRTRILQLWLITAIIVTWNATANAERSTNVPHIPFFTDSSLSAGAQGKPVTNQLDLDRLADSLTKKVLGENRVVNMLDPDKVYTLPLGIVKEIAGMTYTIVLDELRFTPSGALLKVYMTVKFPGSPNPFGLMADSVRVGIDGIESAQLRMLKDKKLKLLGKDVVISAKSTFVEWDCNGYKRARVAGKMYLEAGRFLKENPKSRSLVIGQRVAAHFEGTITDFTDIILQISLDPFQVKGLTGYGFYVKNAVLDMSDSRNPDGIQFPEGYKSVLFDGKDRKLWRGVYINSLAVKFPKKFAKNGEIPEIRASKFLIDLEGFSGRVTYKNQLLSLEKGKLGGWKFSINSFSLAFTKSRVSSFGMGGAIVLPITKKEQPLAYQASIDANKNFLFRVSFPDSLDVPLFGSGSEMILDSNSKITVESKDGNYYPKAELHGRMKLAVPGKQGFSLADITFQGLTVQTRSPQIDVKAFSMTSGAMKGFPVQITGIALERNKRDTLLGLKVDASANLMAEKISGSTAFVIWSKHEQNEWRYRGTEYRKISVNANIGSLALKGGLEHFKEHPTYGTGYLGHLDLSMAPGIRVNAIAQFGNVSGFRYWFADAGLSLPSGIAIFPGFGIYGFGGGAYYHMMRIQPQAVTMANKKPKKAKKPSDTFSIGVSGSGVIYRPTLDVGLGVMAKVIIGTQPNPSAFNGNVTFGIEFTRSYGISKLYFQGNGRFMTELEKDTTDSKVRARVNMQYLIGKRELSGFAEAYVKVADVVRGIGPGDRAGRVDFYFSPKDWYIYIGTPSAPVGLKMKFLKAGGYFMVGTILPDFPPLPERLASLRGKINFSNMRQEGLVGTGGGFAFGASIETSTGEKEYLFFTGSFNMGLGFDFMLRNFGENARCEGHTGQLGINGWYAQGQAWAWVDATIGIRVKVFRKERKFKILDAGFAAVLGAQLPNPTYVAGAVEARYSVLGGLVKGKCHFEFSYGEQCKLVGVSELAGITAISELSPAEGATEVDVFTTPQVVFSIPVEKPFEFLDSEGNTKHFRVKLDYCTLVSDDGEIPCKLEWNSNGDVLALRPNEVLPPQTELRLKVRVHFQEKVASSGWVDYSVDGKVETEEQNAEFRTGEAPDHITEGNVAYTYPVRNMVSFYKNEHGSMYIQLLQGVNYLFSKPGSWRYEAHFVSGNSRSIMPVTYDKSARRVVWSVPDNLANGSIYSLRIVRIDDSGTRYVADSNVVRTDSRIGESTSLTTKRTEGALFDMGLTELYGLHFRTSSFNTFVEKVRSMRMERRYSYNTDRTVQLRLVFTGSAPHYEVFDSWEMAHVRIRSELDRITWYTRNYKKLIYTPYPVAPGLDITNRDAQPVGIPPTNTSVFVVRGEVPSLGSDSLSLSSLRFNRQTKIRIDNHLNYYVTRDWLHLRNRAFGLPSRSWTPAVEKLARSSYVGLYINRSYPISLMYYIPGQDRPTSVFRIKMRY